MNSKVREFASSCLFMAFIFGVWQGNYELIDYIGLYPSFILTTFLGFCLIVWAYRTLTAVRIIRVLCPKIYFVRW
jgi:hypothetical protein